jgi:hypothetical protein
MKKLPIYLSLALAVTSLASCEKELEAVPQPKAQAEAQMQQTPQQLLTNGQWRMTEMTTTTREAGATESITASVFAHLKPALRDDLTQFTAAGSYILDEGASKVKADALQQKAGTFVLSEDAQTLTVKMPDSERKYTVEELTASTLRLKLTEGEGATAVTYVTTFAH